MKLLFSPRFLKQYRDAPMQVQKFWLLRMANLRRTSGPRERTDRFTVGASGICLILALVLLSTIALAGSQARSEPKYLAPVMVRRQVAPARAQVVLDATTRDYGEVFAGEELDYLFNVLNAGKAPLELMQRPLSSRGATPSAARLANRVLQSAGQSFELVRASARLAAPS